MCMIVIEHTLNLDNIMAKTFSYAIKTIDNFKKQPGTIVAAYLLSDRG